MNKIELTKNHREALLNELDKAQQEAETQGDCLRKQKPEDSITEWFDIGLFLAEQRIKLIKQALIDNEIDY